MLHSPAWWYFNIYVWKDLLEIALFSSAFYYLSLWLRQDRQKSLLLGFYGYCLLLTAAAVIPLKTVLSALIMFAPVVLVIFVVLHQEILQRNFVTLHTITPAYAVDQDWTEILIRSCLVALSDNKAINCVIQKGNALDTLLTSPSRFDCNISEGLLDVVIHSESFDTSKILWLQNNGILVSINSEWKKTSVETWLAQAVKEQEPWLQDALFYTAKTDALFIKLHPQTRTFSLVAEGKLLEQVSAHAALKTIKKYLGHYKDTDTKGEVHASGQKVPSSEQSLT